MSDQTIVYKYILHNEKSTIWMPYQSIILYLTALLEYLYLFQEGSCVPSVNPFLS